MENPATKRFTLSDKLALLSLGISGISLILSLFYGVVKPNLIDKPQLEFSVYKDPILYEHFGDLGLQFKGEFLNKGDKTAHTRLTLWIFDKSNLDNYWQFSDTWYTISKLLDETKLDRVHHIYQGAHSMFSMDMQVTTSYADHIDLYGEQGIISQLKIFFNNQLQNYYDSLNSIGKSDPYFSDASRYMHARAEDLTINQFKERIRKQIPDTLRFKILEHMKLYKRPIPAGDYYLVAYLPYEYGAFTKVYSFSLSKKDYDIFYSLGKELEKGYEIIHFEKDRTVKLKIKELHKDDRSVIIKDVERIIKREQISSSAI